MVIMNKTCHKFGKMVEMMRAKVEEVRTGMIPLVNIVKWHLKCFHCHRDENGAGENDNCENDNDEGEEEVLADQHFEL